MKKGISFFPMSCTQSTAEEVLEAEFGAPATALILTLYRKIYGENGFYCDFSWQMQRVLARKLGIEQDRAYEIIKTALALGLFDQTMYDQYEILTSMEIQEHYFYAVTRRKCFEFERKYLLLRDDQLPKMLQLHPREDTQHTDDPWDTHPENADILQANVDIPQAEVTLNEKNADIVTTESQKCQHDADSMQQTKQYNTIQNDTKQDETTVNETTQNETTQQTIPTHPQELQEDDEGYFGSYANVRLRFCEFKTLVQRYGEFAVDRYIERLSTYMATKHREYRDHANTLLDWMEQDGVKTLNGR